MVILNPVAEVEIRHVECRIKSVQDRIDFVEAILSKFQYGDKVWLRGLTGRRSTDEIVQGVLGYVHPRGRYINLFIDGQNYQQSIICVGSMFIEENMGDDKYLNKKGSSFEE